MERSASCILRASALPFEGWLKHFTEVEPYKEISFERAIPRIHKTGYKFCTYMVCPVPVGTVKVAENEAKLALPTDATIKLSKTKEE